MSKYILVLALTYTFFIGFANSAYAQIFLPNPLSAGSFLELIENITAYISTVVGALAVLMFIISGIVFLSSAGNPGKIEQAKKIAIYAAVGTAIALAGQGLIQLVAFIIGG